MKNNPNTSARPGIPPTQQSHIPHPRVHRSYVQPPTHSGPPEDSLVITYGVPPIIVRYPPGRVEQFSRHQIARALHMTPSACSQLFSGKRNLTIPVALKLRKFLGVTLDYLVDELMPSTIYKVHEHITAEQARILNARQLEEVEPKSGIILTSAQQSDTHPDTPQSDDESSANSIQL